MIKNYKIQEFPLQKLTDKQFFIIQNQNEKPQGKRKTDKYFFKNSKQQDSCILAIGPQGSGKSKLFEDLYDFFKDKQNSFLFIVSSLPQRELNDQIKKLQVKEGNYKIFTHNDKQDYFKQIYDELTNYIEYFYQCKDIAENDTEENINKQIQILKQNLNQNDNAKIMQTKQKIIEYIQKLKQIQFYEVNKNIQLKFFIFVDDLLKLPNSKLPYFELILRNFRHFGGVLFYVTAQGIMVIPRQLRDLFTHILLFRGLPQDRIELIAEQQKLPLEKQKLIDLYYDNTQQPHDYVILQQGQGIPSIQTKSKIVLLI